MMAFTLLTSLLSFIFGIFVCFISPAIATDNIISLKVATWNIENLRADADKDFRQLQDYAEVINADIVALQEVDGIEAARRVFDEDDYQFFFSGRNHPQRTGFAVRKGITVQQNPDYEELDVGGLRYGTDITVQLDNQQVIRMLSVHLKSGCFQQSLTGTMRGGCIKLQKQLPILEAWIDTQAAEEIPFIVLGDFNRRFNQSDDDFWQEIDDGEPPNADLTKVTNNRISTCFDGQYPKYIDHIVLDKQTSQWWENSSFEQFDYGQPLSRQKCLSDHCAIAISLEIPASKPSTDLETEILNRVREAIDQLEELKSILQTQ